MCITYTHIRILNIYLNTYIHIYIYIYMYIYIHTYTYVHIIYIYVNTDTVYFEAGPLNETICVAPLATPPLDFLKLVTN